MLKVQKQTFRPMEQNTDPRVTPTTMGSINLWQGSRNIQWEKTASSINHVGKTGQPSAKQSSWTLSLWLSHLAQK